MALDATPTQTAVVIGLISAATYLGWYLFNKRKDTIPTSWVQIGVITKLYMYPLKSGSRMELVKVECAERGFKQIRDDNNFPLVDRGLLVYKEDASEFRTARTYPKLLKIDISVHDEQYLAVDAPTMRTLYVKIPKGTEEKHLIKYWDKEQVKVIDLGDEAARWFSRYIFGEDKSLRLGFYTDDAKRNINSINAELRKYYTKLRGNSLGRYSDLSSIHLINQASINDLKQRLDNPDDVSAVNFRPNIVVDGKDIKPYDEDKWDFMKLGESVVIRNVKECTRCVMTTINPDTTEKNKNREPLKTLGTYRMANGPEKAPVMGINLEVYQTGILKVGDPVFIPANNI